MGIDEDAPQMTSTEELCAYAFLDEVVDESGKTVGEQAEAADTNPPHRPASADIHGVETIKQTFRACDSNGDGMVTPAELKALFQLLGDWTDDDFDALMSATDQNEDGQLVFDEFVTWLMHCGIDSDSLNMAPAYAQALAESAAAAKPEEQCATYLQAPASYEQAVAEYAEGTPSTSMNSWDELQACQDIGIVTDMSLTHIGNFNMDNDGRYTADMLLNLKPLTTKLCSLKTLNLGENVFGDDAMPALVSCLHYLPSLESLDLSLNGLTEVGCSIIMESLSQDAMPHLTRLSLECNPVAHDADAVARLTSTFKNIRGEGDEAKLVFEEWPFA